MHYAKIDDPEGPFVVLLWKKVPQNPIQHGFWVSNSIIVIQTDPLGELQAKDIVAEALAWGWIDSHTRKLDDQRSL